MRRFLNSKVVTLVLLVLIVSLVAGVVWAASPGSRPSAAEGPAVGANLVLEEMTIVEGKPIIRVFGSGFKYPEAVFVEVVRGGEEPGIPIGGGLTNISGAFDIKSKKVRGTLEPGIYTVMATGSGGTIATAPLLVTEKPK